MPWLGKKLKIVRFVNIESKWFFRTIIFSRPFFIQEKFCNLVNFECPSEEDFNYFDTNGDGMLTLDEYYENMAWYLIAI